MEFQEGILHTGSSIKDSNMSSNLKILKYNGYMISRYQRMLGIPLIYKRSAGDIIVFEQSICSKRVSRLFADGIMNNICSVNQYLK